MFAAVRKHVWLFAFCCATSVGILVAEGGCSSSSTPGPLATATPASITIALPTAGAALVFPPHKGFSGQLIVPANNAPAGTMVTVQSFTKAPSNAPSAQIVVPDDHTGRPHPMALPSGSQTIFLLEISYTQAFQFSQYPSHTFTIPSQFPTTNATFELELFVTNNNPQYTWTDPTINGQTITFGPSSGQGQIVSQNVPYWEELVYIPNAGPSPSPSPSTSPSPSPSPTPTVSPSPTASPTTSPSPSPSPTGTPTPGACAYPASQLNNLYVAAQVSENIIEFPGASGSGQVIQSFPGAPLPFDVVFDHNQNMWVDESNQGNGPSTLKEFAPPYTGQAIASVTPGQFEIPRIAFDNDENLFVTAGGVGGVNVSEYAPPYTGSPILSLNVGNVSVNLDADCNLYVGDINSFDMLEYAPPYTGSPIRTITNALFGLFGGTATDSHGDLWVGSGGEVDEYGPTGTTKLVQILTSAIDVQVDPSDNVWTLDDNGAIREYKPPYTGGPAKTLTSGLWNQPVGMRFGP